MDTPFLFELCGGATLELLIDWEPELGVGLCAGMFGMSV